MNIFLLEAKRHPLSHSWLMQSSGIWIAVLLIHFFLWIIFNNERDMPRSHQNKSSYLSVVLITLKDPARAPQIVESSRKEVSKTSAISSKQKSKKLPGLEETPEPQKPPLLSTDVGSEKPAMELDFDEMKRAALAVTHEPQKRLLPGATEKISASQKFAEAIDHAKRGDCRSEYAYIGLLAIPLLLKDTLTGEGCKW